MLTTVPPRLHWTQAFRRNFGMPDPEGTRASQLLCLCCVWGLTWCTELQMCGPSSRVRAAVAATSMTSTWVP